MHEVEDQESVLSYIQFILEKSKTKKRQIYFLLSPLKRNVPTYFAPTYLPTQGTKDFEKLNVDF